MNGDTIYFAKGTRPSAARFVISIYGVEPGDVDGWECQVMVLDRKYEDVNNPGCAVDAIAGGPTWEHAYRHACEQIKIALEHDECVFADGASKPLQGTYERAIAMGHDLIDATENREYVRGIVELIADTFGYRNNEYEMHDAKLRIGRDLGLPADYFAMLATR